MTLDLRIIFLVLLGLTAFFFILRGGNLLTGKELIEIVLDFVLVLAVAGTVISFGFILTRRDPLPLIRELAYRLSFEQLVSFEHIIPTDLARNLTVSDISRADLDGDGFKEWVVFYQYDLQNPASPVAGAVYDNDRGNPPVIFPYNLRPPRRDYLSEGQVSYDLTNVTIDQNGPQGADLPEILVRGTKELSIFRFRENSELWDFPRDAPPRYQPIGFFRGSGGVSFDQTTKRVTVIDRDGFERSQLVNRTIYALNKSTNTYWDQFYDPAALDRKLAAPVISTIDFLGESPKDILDVALPEKIVLAFYAATCSSAGEALCRHSGAGWTARDFLDANGDAFANFRDKKSSYFGLPALSHADISVKYLRYYPQLETDTDLLTAGGGRDVVTGEQGQSSAVDITFVIAGNAQEQMVRYAMAKVGDQWKINHRLPLDLPTLGAPTQIPATPQQ